MYHFYGLIHMDEAYHPTHNHKHKINALNMLKNMITQIYV